jgi:hypothetical protein
MRFHRLTVDAYAVQHPGRPSPQTIQSVAVHLIGLYRTFVLEEPPRVVTGAIQRAAELTTYHWLPPPQNMGAITVADVLSAGTPEEHARAVQEWARSAWEAWSTHHARVEAWAEAAAVY